MDAGPPPDVPVLEVFYASTCTPCRLELPTLAQLTADPRVRLRIVLLTDEKAARAELVEVSPALDAAAVVAEQADQRATLRAAGDADGILPYARVVKPDGNACATWRGGLGMERIDAMLAACRKP